MKQERLDELKELCEYAMYGVETLHRVTNDDGVVTTIPGTKKLGKAFIAIARLAIPELIDEVEKLQEENALLWSAIEEIREVVQDNLNNPPCRR